MKRSDVRFHECVNMDALRRYVEGVNEDEATWTRYRIGPRHLLMRTHKGALHLVEEAEEHVTIVPVRNNLCHIFTTDELEYLLRNKVVTQKEFLEAVADDDVRSVTDESRKNDERKTFEIGGVYTVHGETYVHVEQDSTVTK